MKARRGAATAGRPEPVSRLADVLRPGLPQSPGVVLLGVPDDTGVHAVGGRPGAAGGPAAFRQALQRYGTSYDFGSGTDLASLPLGDAGDVQVAPGDTPTTHRRTTERVAVLLQAGHRVVCVGGGHDLTFAHVRALLQPLRGVNVDAHPDVRPLAGGRITSGSPYYLMYEELTVEAFWEIGLQPAVCRGEHIQYLRSKGARIVPLAEFHPQAFEEAVVGAHFVSLDLDGVAQAFAPGVSAPNPDGFTPREMLAMARRAGREPSVRLLDIMELNPRFDVDGRTARLAVALFLAFLHGHAETQQRG